MLPRTHDMQQRYFMALLLAAALYVTLSFSGTHALAADEVADQPVFSGPQPGEKLPVLSVRNIFTDPPTDVEIVGAKSEDPLLLVFFHKRTRPAFGLTNALFRFLKAEGGDKLKGHIVFLTPDITETSNWLKRIKQLLPDPASCGISTEGAEGPGSYGLNRDVTLTVIVANKGKVTGNFALVQPSLETDGNKILKAVAEATGIKKQPDILKFANQQMRQPEPQRPGRGAERGTQDERLTGMLREAIQKDAKPEAVDVIVKRIEEYVAKNEAARTQLGSIASRIVEAKRVENYGTERVQKALRDWAEKFGPKTSTDESKTSEKGSKTEPKKDARRDSE